MDFRLRGAELRLWSVCLLIALICAGVSRLASGQRAARAKARPGPACVSVVALMGNGESATDGGQAAPVSRDVCVAAHVYQVVELEDGTRFLDVCPATTQDADCRFVLLSLPADREEVGDLRRLSGVDIELRGTLRPMHGRMGIFLSHARQLEGGPEKFRPNARLLRDFNAESERMAVRDPNLRASGHHRSFMNRQLKESVPAGKP